MNLLQIKQKMLEKSISESYLAECCGVSKLYLHQALAGTIPMTNKLNTKINGVIKSLELGKAVKERKKTKESTERVEALLERKKEIGCSYKELSEHTERKYRPAYLNWVLNGGANLSKEVERQLIKAFCLIEQERKEVPTKEETWGQALCKNGEKVLKELEEERKCLDYELASQLFSKYGYSEHYSRFELDDAIVTVRVEIKQKTTPQDVY